MKRPTSLAEGRYRLVEVLGSGGMATVFRAYDERLQVYRAIKVLNSNLSRNATIRERFLTEARTMARLHHPNIVGVHDIVSEDQWTYMVMELVHAGSLADWCKRHGAMPPRMAAQAVLSTLRALELSHDEGVVHRDIKPQNILITVKGKPKVTDFGIAQVRDDNVSLTKTGATMGTLGYMAPEQRINARGVDQRSDVYASGATLWALLKNAQPVDLFLAEMGKPQIVEGIPEPLADVIRRACRYDQQDRYPDAESMAEALAQALPLLPEDEDAIPPLSSGAPEGMPDARTPPPLPPNPSETMIPDGFGAPGRETYIPDDLAAAMDQGGGKETMIPDSFDDAAAGVGLAVAGEPPKRTAPPPVVDSGTSEAPTGGTLLGFEDEDEDEPIAAPNHTPKLVGGVALLALLGVGGWVAWGPSDEPAPVDPIVEPAVDPPVDPVGEPVDVVEPVDEPPVEPVDEPPVEVAPDPVTPDPVVRDPTPRDPVVRPPVDEPDDPVVEEPPDDPVVEAPPVEVAPAAPEPGRILVTGDALSVRFVGPAGTFKPGAELPAGTYQIKASFSDGVPVVAGNVTVAEGQTRTVNCVAGFDRCSPK